MRIVLDTTALFTDFRLTGAAFRVLRGGLQKLGWELIVPQVVFDETVNHHVKRTTELCAAIEKARHELERHLRLDALKLTLSPDANVEREKYSAYLTRTLGELKATIAPYPSVPHEALAKRAMAYRKPFNSKGAGYRDALIWQTVLDILRVDDTPVQLVTANKNDFGSGPTPDADLLRDMTEQGQPDDRVRIFASIEELNQHHIIPSLKRLDDLAEALRTDKVDSFHLTDWIRSDLKNHLEREDATLMSPLGDLCPSRVTGIEKLRSCEVDEVRLIPPGDFLVFVTAEVDVELSIDADWGDYVREREVREYFGGDSEPFSFVTTNEVVRYKIGFSLVLEAGTFKLLAFEVDDFTGEHGDSEINPHPR